MSKHPYDRKCPKCRKGELIATVTASVRYPAKHTHSLGPQTFRKPGVYLDAVFWETEHVFCRACDYTVHPQFKIMRMVDVPKGGRRGN